MNRYSQSTSPPRSSEGQNGLKHHGVVVPMVTPILANGDLDEPAVDRLVEFLLRGGVDGIFVLGTTGEGESVLLRLDDVGSAW